MTFALNKSLRLSLRSSSPSWS